MNLTINSPLLRVVQGGFETSYAATEALSTVVATAKDSYREIAGNNFLLQAFKPVIGIGTGIAQLVGSSVTRLPDYVSNIAESLNHSSEAFLQAAIIAPLQNRVLGITDLFATISDWGNGSLHGKDSLDIAQEITMLAGAVLLVGGVGRGRGRKKGMAPPKIPDVEVIVAAFQKRKKGKGRVARVAKDLKMKRTILYRLLRQTKPGDRLYEFRIRHLSEEELATILRNSVTNGKLNLAKASRDSDISRSKLKKKIRGAESPELREFKQFLDINKGNKTKRRAKGPLTDEAIIAELDKGISKRRAAKNLGVSYDAIQKHFRNAGPELRNSPHYGEYIANLEKQKAAQARTEARMREIEEERAALQIKIAS